MIFRLDRRLYPSQSDRLDNGLLLQRILDRVSANSVVLDLGAGAGIVPEMNIRGAAYECMVNLSDVFSAFRILLLVEPRKSRGAR